MRDCSALLREPLPMVWSLNKFQPNASWVFCLNVGKRILTFIKKSKRAGEMTQWLRVLALQTWGLEFKSAVPMWRAGHDFPGPWVGVSGGRQISGVCWPDSQAEMASGSVRICLNVKRQVMEEGTPHTALVSTCLHTGMNLHTPMYVCTTHTSHRNERDSELPEG